MNINYKLLLLVLFIVGKTNAQPGGSRNGYSRDGVEAANKYIKILFDEPFIFAKGSINVKGDKGENKPAIMEALAESDKVIKEYELKIEEFLKTKPNQFALKNSYPKVTAKLNGLKYAIEAVADGLMNGRSLTYVGFLQELYLYKAFIAGAMKVYPEAVSLQEKYDQTEEAIKKYGSREDYMAAIQKNNIEYAKKLRLKKAVMSDPAIEKTAKTQFEKWFERDKVTVVKTVITSVWVIEKNALDIPLYKEAELNFAIKKADGSCGFATAYIRQVYEGGGKYGAPLINMPSGIITIPCENLLK